MRLTFWLKKLCRLDFCLFLALGAGSLLQASDVNFWVMDGRQSTISVNGPVAHEQNKVFFVTCWVTFVIFILVGGALAYVTLKYKARSSADEHAEPPAQSHGNPMVEILLIAASVFSLVIIAVPTLKAIWYTYDVPAKADGKRGDAFEVTATGEQWWFKFEYPSVLINGAGPLLTANELVIPAGQPVRLNLRTTDVIHSFWVPKLAGKVDMIPNRPNFLWLQADEPGYFYGQCAEYCGDSHAVMRFRVIALGPKDFNNWLDSQLQPARTVTPNAASTATPKAQFASLRKPESFKQNEYGFTQAWDTDSTVSHLDLWTQKQFPEANEDAALIAKGRKLFQAKTCIICHTIRGHEGVGVLAPDLTHFGARTTLAAGLLENNAEEVQRWIHNPGAVKPGNKMFVGFSDHNGTTTMQGYMTKDAQGHLRPNIVLTPDEETALVAYLQSLK